MNYSELWRLPYLSMKNVIKLEEAAITAASVYFLSKYNLGLPAWAWALLFFSPDLSILGYVAGNRTGAFVYNFFHQRGIALLVAGIGLFVAQDILPPLAPFFSAIHPWTGCSVTV